MHKLINAIDYISRIRDKIHMIICINADKAMVKIQNPLQRKTLNKLVIERIILNNIKVIHTREQTASR